MGPHMLAEHGVGYPVIQHWNGFGERRPFVHAFGPGTYFLQVIEQSTRHFAARAGRRGIGHGGGGLAGGLHLWARIGGLNRAGFDAQGVDLRRIGFHNPPVVVDGDTIARFEDGGALRRGDMHPLPCVLEIGFRPDHVGAVQAFENRRVEKGCARGRCGGCRQRGGAGPPALFGKHPPDVRRLHAAVRRRVFQGGHPVAPHDIHPQG